MKGRVTKLHIELVTEFTVQYKGLFKYKPLIELSTELVIEL